MSRLRDNDESVFMRQNLVQAFIAFALGASAVVLYQSPATAAEEDGGSCAKCNSDATICNSAATGSNYCTWINNKCQGAGGGCGKSPG